MLWSIDTCQNKVSTDQYHVTISCLKFRANQGQLSLELTADQALGFDWIACSSQVNLLQILINNPGAPLLGTSELIALNCMITVGYI